MSTVPGRAASRKPDAVSEITARRNKLLGLWATERMGMMGDVAAEYVLPAGDRTAERRSVAREEGLQGYARPRLSDQQPRRQTSARGMRRGCPQQPDRRCNLVE